MNTGDANGTQLRKNLILASAYFHAPPPQGHNYANCARVLRHAMSAAGLWEDHFREAFHGDEENATKFPEFQQWYASLIELTRQEPPSERLLEGGGNLDLPAGAYYTGCWITPTGLIIAERLLAEHPEWRAKLTASAKQA